MRLGCREAEGAGLRKAGFFMFGAGGRGPSSRSDD